MIEKCQRCTHEFRDEWEKRFLELSKLQDYHDVYVRVYEKYFTDAEINELFLTVPVPSGELPAVFSRNLGANHFASAARASSLQVISLIFC
jgi:hypothetical protein